MVQLINNFTVSCREIINNELVNVNYVSAQPENCNCDFRINLRYCKGEQIYIVATWILVVYSILIGGISMYFLYKRTFAIGQSIFFPPSRFRGILRPRPQETFHLICCSSNLLQIIHLLIKLFDGYKNTLYAELYLDIPRLVSYALATLYPISIIHSTPNIDPNTTVAIGWTPNKHLIDIVGFSLMICPFISNIPLAILTGYYADINEIEKAKFFLKIHYIMWSFWTFVLLMTLAFFWYKLISILNKHIKVIDNQRHGSGIIFFNENKLKLDKLKSSAKNLTTVVVSFGSIFLLYSASCLMTALLFKSSTIYNMGLNICSMLLMNYIIPISFNIAQIALLYHKLRPTRKDSNSTPLDVFSPKRQSNVSYMSNRSNKSHDDDPDITTIPTIPNQKPKPTSLELLHYYNDDNTSVVNKPHSEIFSYHHLNKSDKQIYRYGCDSSSSSPRSFKFNHKYSSLDSSTLIGTNRHNSVGIYSLNSTYLGSLSNLSSSLSSPDKDEFHIYQKNFDVHNQKEGRASCSTDERRMIDFDEDDGLYNIDRKEWLAKKPKRIPLKKCTL